jgi:hypothetical protein
MTIKEAAQQGYINLNLNSVIRQHAAHKDRRYSEPVELTLTKMDIAIILGILGGHKKTKYAIACNLEHPYRIKACGILDRLMFDISDTFPEGHWHYCAGQDYPAEINTVRGLLK